MLKTRLLQAFTVAVALLMAVPAVYVFALSFKDSLSGYADFFLWKTDLLKALGISVLISGASSIGTVLVALPAAYVFAKFNFKGKNILFYIYIMVMMMPFQVTLLPQYLIAKELGTYDTAWSLILPSVFAPFAVFLLTQMIKSVPNEILEAARLDTNSQFKVLQRVVVPSIKPGIICCWVLVFCEQYNAVAEPLVLLETAEKYPLSLAISQLEPTTAIVFAATTVFMLLPLILYGLFEAEIINGLGDYRLK